MDWAHFISIAGDIISAVSHVATIIALIIGGVWTFQLYRQKRQRYPQAEVTHETT